MSPSSDRCSRPPPPAPPRSKPMRWISKRPGKVSRCLVINARKLDYFDAANVRLVMSVADVTDVRISEKLKDDLLREKAILLQELQHRVANSLQIIASVLMQGARKVRSEQARGHLRDARNRVMSIATMQRQLAASRLGDVVLRDYFTDLCASIGASMISDHDQLSLKVTVDDSADQGGRLGQPRPDRHRAGDQRPQARLPAPPERQDMRRLPVGRAGVDPVGARHRHRHGGQMLPMPSRAWAPASSRRWPGNWALSSRSRRRNPERRYLSSTGEAKRVMRTAIECLAKASELEERAAQCAEPAARVQFLEAAIRWRDLARRALVHEQHGITPYRR